MAIIIVTACQRGKSSSPCHPERSAPARSRRIPRGCRACCNLHRAFGEGACAMLKQSCSHGSATGTSGSCGTARSPCALPEGATNWLLFWGTSCSWDAHYVGAHFNAPARFCLLRGLTEVSPYDADAGRSGTESQSRLFFALLSLRTGFFVFAAREVAA